MKKDKKDRASGSISIYPKTHLRLKKFGEKYGIKLIGNFASTVLELAMDAYIKEVEAEEEANDRNK